MEWTARARDRRLPSGGPRPLERAATRSLPLREDEAVKSWDWKWEETRSQPQPQPPPQNHPPADVRDRPPGRRPRLRRRRVAAALVGAMLLVLAIVAIAGNGSVHHARTTAGTVRGSGTTTATRPTPARSEAIARAEEERAINHVLSYTPAVIEGGHSGHEVALTFDDGPAPTPSSSCESSTTTA